MSLLKRIFTPTYIVLTLLIVSLAGVGYFAARDCLTSPEEHFEKGLVALKADNHKLAERSFLKALESKRNEIALLAGYQLGRLYRTGGGRVSADGAKAALFFEKSAQRGFSPAQYELALLYDVGDKVPENRALAVQWMNAAAQNGLPEALYGLAVWSERGYLGEVPQAKIVALYEQAAAKGHLDAMRSLSAIYGGGYGTFPKNVEKSVYWINQVRQRTEQPEKNPQ